MGIIKRLFGSGKAEETEDETVAREGRKRFKEADHGIDSMSKIMKDLNEAREAKQAAEKLKEQRAIIASVENDKELQKRNIPEQLTWEDLYRKYFDYIHKRDEWLKEGEELDSEALNQIISEKEIEELRRLSQKTYRNENPNIKTFAEEMELSDLHNEACTFGKGKIELPEDKKEREKELMKKLSFYDSDDNILKQVEGDMEGGDED